MAEQNNAEQWLPLPIPPPFMWACPGCASLLDVLHEVWDNPEDDCFWEQVSLACHIANTHPEEIPAPHPDCYLCETYSSRPDDKGLVWAQHRARDFFLPPSIARSM